MYVSVVNSVYGVCTQQTCAGPSPSLPISPYAQFKMLGALNRFISRLDSESPSQSSRNGHPSFGFQVLRNKNQEIAIDPWYDFVIGINGRQIVR